MTTLERPTTLTAEEILEAYAKKPKQLWQGWADHHINFKVGPATAELHSGYGAFRTVYSVRVKEKRRGQGHGRRLMDVIVAYADATGTGLNLTVYGDNEAAIRLYKSVGFRITNTRDDGTHWMERYPTRIPSTPAWDKHFEEKALRLERDHEPRLGGDHWVAFFDALYKAQMTPTNLGRADYTGSRNYGENTRRLSCDATGALLVAAGWTITRTQEV